MASEQDLITKLDVPARTVSVPELLRHINLFWQTFSLHKRTCDRTGKDIISVFDKHCPYPVWHQDEWIAHANPPSGELDLSKPFFEQLWTLFQSCPIPHNTGIDNENCDYTDDWWHSKKCYLSHSGLRCEDVYYSYRVVECRNCFFCVFCNNCELSTDLTNCTNCYSVTFALDSHNCRDSAFLFDCRNCTDCFFCFNLRNKQYCIGNKQYTKEEYLVERQKWQLGSRQVYEQAKKEFQQLIFTRAWWRAQHVEQVENVIGEYVREAKNCENVFFVDKCQDVINCLRAFDLKDAVNSSGSMGSELLAYTSLAQHSYDAKFCVSLMNCKFVEYCINCTNCENCFACCGLVGKNYHIMNKAYSPEEYQRRVAEIKASLRANGTYGQIFPGYFSPCSYEDSISSFYWPLSREDQTKLNYRIKQDDTISSEGMLSPTAIPDNAVLVSNDIVGKSFFDEVAKRPFSIQAFDLEHSKRQNVPLPNSFYARRTSENFRWMFFDGTLRETTCAATGQKILTALPKALDGRILSQAAYEEKVL